MAQDKKDGNARLTSTAFRFLSCTLLCLILTTVNATAGVKVTGNVYGGGNKADVGGSVTVNMTGGTVEGDVYGGGALANTNINNATNYGTGDEDVPSTSTDTTVVKLNGGTIKGDAYGGGLGDLAGVGAGHTDKPAKVYGDVKVYLGGDHKGATDKATAFYTSYVTTDESVKVVSSGRIFGCNNLNGAPLGDVTVTVYKTVEGKKKEGETETSLKRTATENLHKTEATHTYEVAAVYGGGNLADYTTTTGKKTHVNILTCDVSVESVYGGGNAAAVPATEVQVKGAYEIAYVFGGGNGKDKWTIDGGTTWTANAGANVNGNARTQLNGGYIHEAYGGSNEKGTITGSASLEANETADKACDLEVVKLVGAGKNADIDGDAILVLGCMPSAKIDQIFGGADNANVKGNVELTITSGNFRQVFGGNNIGGMINGHIILNIEETGCRAIEIDELYLGGNEAPYSIYGYYDSSTTDANGKKIYSPKTAEDDGHTAEAYPAEDTTHKYPFANPVLNVISCTRIGQVFGGGLGSGAVMYGSPTVNLNMIPGTYAEDIKLSGSANAHDLGNIGNVYGGGKEAAVHGNTTVNIGTAAKVYFTSEPTSLGTKGTDYTEVTGESDPHKGQFEATAEGARITGNVYGGGLAANVDGNTEVNVGTVAYTTTDFEKVTIGGDVYGGGEGHTTNVTGTAHVNLGADGVGNSTVSGDIYGGSAFGTVNTSDVNLYHGTASQNVFGGGKGQLESGVVNTEGYQAPYSATITTSATVSLLGATVTEDIYGGCNENGTAATTTVKLLGGSTRDAFGGGLGENTGVTNHVLVEVGKYDAEAETNKISGNATVRDVYGGSAKGKVNNADAGIANNAEAAKTTHTYVNLYAGTVTGDVYGGGLGTADVAAQGDNPAVTGIAAIVYGDVAVKLNEHDGTASVGGRVFGCNNLKGTPKGAVTVDVYKTSRKDDDGNVIATKPARIGDPDPTNDPKPLAYLTATDTQVDNQTYELAAVFGGGNQAAYDPTSSNSVTTVHIHNCETNSIKEVYGGGNAADVPNCAVNIDGAWEIGYVYGGGNGTTDVAANVTGNATTTIRGGTIYRTFGGSNTNGDIAASTLNIADGDNTDVCKQPKLGDVFSYGNKAEMNHPATVNLSCLANKVGALYGGAMNANVNSDITLNVNGGSYAKVFGGNKTGGSINGFITVNVEETGACAVNIDKLFGCGNEAPYSVYGTEKVNGVWTVKTEGNTRQPDPQVNLYSFTNIGAVYGAGLGSSAEVWGNPSVNINITKASGYTLTNVYGGGYGADVTGNTTINIADRANVTLPSNSTSTAVSGAAISGDVFGGGYGASTHVTGTATINIGERSGSAGSYTYTDRGASFLSTSNIYGGSALGTVATSEVNLYAGTIAANVFGGGKGRLASGTEGQEDYVEAQGATISTKATVNLCAATVTGNIYGGCNDNGTTAEAELNLLGGTVGTSGSVEDMVFGGGKGHATTTNTATVNVGSDTSTGTSSIYSNVYGGSALGTVGTAIVDLNSVTTLTGHVFGGGMGCLASGTEGQSDYVAAQPATITTSATVNQYNITLAADKDIYGGCNINGTAAATYVYLLGGSVRDVFGGGLGQHTGVTGNVLVEIGHYNSNTKALSGTATVTHDVYGGSAKGAVNTNTDNTTTVNLWKGTINGDVYGGGLGVKSETPAENILAVVNGNVRVNLNGYDSYDSGTETITPVSKGECVVKGNIFGGNNANGSPSGTAEVHIYKTVGYEGHTRTATPTTAAAATYELAAVYGGGNLAAFTGSTTNVVIETCDPSIETVYGGGNAANASNTSVLVKGAYEIGTVFGGGNGEESAANVPGTATTVLNGGLIHDFYGGSNTSGTIGTYNESTHETSGGPVITIDDLQIGTDCSLKFDNIYGAGKNAHVDGNIRMTMGCLSDEFTVQNLYGGAKAANVKGNVTLTVTSGQFTNVFGGNDESGTIGGNITVNLEETGCQPLKITNVYGGGNRAPYTGNTTVNLKSFTSVGNVYGGGLGAEAIVTGSTTVNVNQVPGDKAALIDADGKGGADNNPNALGTVGNVYGGGSEASVVGNTTVNIGTETTVTMVSLEDDASTTDDERVKNVTGVNITGDVYGGGYGHLTNVSENVAVVIGTTANTYSPAIGGDVYGGSALGKVNGAVDTPVADPSKHTTVTLNKGVVTGSVYGGGLGNADHAATVYGAVTVTVNGGKAANVFGCNNVNGSPQSTVAVYVNGTDAVAVGASAIGNVYGGGNMAKYTYADAAHPLLVEINGGTTYATAGKTCTIGNVYGGGLSADVAGSIIVKIKGGKVLGDVYGGGALANTNTANWTVANESDWGVWQYDEKVLEETTHYEPLGILASGTKVKGKYTYDNNTNTYTEITADDAEADGKTEYFQLHVGKISAGYYIKDGTEYKPADTDWANANTTYYSRKIKGQWASTTPYTTTVELTGGVVGNVYGGGLGREAQAAVPASGTPGTNSYVPAQPALSAVAAIVYGDVAVTLGNGTKATGLLQEVVTPAGSETAVPISGRVFGCNNINGTPLGNVTVRVNNTQQLNGDGQPIPGHSDNNYDVHSVYGGGNQARYQPASGKETKVLIYGCDKTSIEKAFGGGNSAAVPKTTVVIVGTHRIGYVFGGGNGADMVKKGSTWVVNDGAPIYGDATVIAIGGRIGMTFAGSDTKGTVWGSATTKLNDGQGNISGYDDGTENCPLKITHSYGAGRGADINADVNFIVNGCTADSQIETVFGGSYDANIRGNINLTITGGVYTQVFGGNDHGGNIGGNITVNIEESETCNPTIIQYLFGGSREAAYPGAEAKNIAGTPVTRGKITVNVKSATRIDNVYGGGWRAVINGDTEVNVNMIKGSWANHDYNLPAGYRGNTIPNSNMTVNYNEKVVTVGETIVTGLYIKDENNNYTQITEQEDTAKSGITYFEAIPTGTIHINDSIGTIGNIFGGSYRSEIHGNATVNIGTAAQVDILMRQDEVNGGGLVHPGAQLVDAEGHSVYDANGKLTGTPATVNKEVRGARITGNIYGGGDLATMDSYKVQTQSGTADAGGNTFVNICAVKNSDTYEAVDEAPDGVTIEGNVYGGGRGLADDFFCRNGMVGHEGDNLGQTPDTNDGTTVRIGNGTVYGSVYGGGEVARVEWSSHVTVGLPTTSVTSAPVILSNVFGGGKGVSTHGYSALLRGDTHVTVQANAKVRECVYGGGEIASVGRYNVALDKETASEYGVGIGMPYSLANAKTGQCHVTVQGEAEIGPVTPMTMPTFFGNVFGGGKGVLPYEGYSASETPWRIKPDNTRDNYNTATYTTEEKTKTEYLKYIETLALATRTYVTIDGNAFVKGSVYGGSEEGIVQQNTLVKIKGGQIGAGEGETTAYSSGWINPLTETITSLKECAHWPYREPYAPYDMYANASGNYPSGSAISSSEGGRPTGSDGHTYYGNVFGGGCGRDPYRPGEWHTNAGAVRGNTRIEITGGHILTNVYGGNEMTNVGNDGVDTTGVCTIKMTDGTIGVPRTLDEIAAHPVTCYLFGGGKGDQRVLFNKETNVKDAIVEITGGTIYGSVFGGGEDGHVMRNVEMTIGDNNGGPTIGTWGTSYVDGNVFGGGRGYSGEALTAGNVGGGIDLKIKGGTMLGSIYGGGRLASVGYGLYLVDEEIGEGEAKTKPYGKMRADDEYDNPAKPISTQTASVFFTKGRGHVEIEISGGTIGNDYENIIPSGTNIDSWTTDQWQTWKNEHHVPYTEFVYDKDLKLYRLSHTKGGNVFAGGMGRLYDLDNTTVLPLWQKLGKVKSTKLTISGSNTLIKGNVYGGGELGWVDGFQKNKNVSTEILISGGTIGTEVEDGSNTKYTFGSVYGGGYGSTVEKLEHKDPINNEDVVETNPKFTAGRVTGSTNVDIQDGTVKASVYGGGEVASIGLGFWSFKTRDSEGTVVEHGNGVDDVAFSEADVEKVSTTVNVRGGIIGQEGFGGATMGNVYGGGNGNRSIVRCGLVLGNTNVTISGAPKIYHNIYGGGAYGTVGDFDYHQQKEDVEQDGVTVHVVKVQGVEALHTVGTGVANVTITGGTIGTDGHNNGMVFGSSRGDVTDPAPRDDYMAWVYDTHVTIGTAGNDDDSTPSIRGSVYGSGENGHTFHDTDVKMYSGTVGLTTAQSTDPEDQKGAKYPYRGNVYGAGCGTDTYTYNNEEHYKPMAGIVLGNTSVEIDGGLVVHNVYGAGSMGSVGKVDTDEAHTIISGGKATITVSGGTIGVDGNENGNVFGAARGDATITQDSLALAKTTIVTISTAADVKGSVFGGGEAGLVQDSTKVSMTGGNVAQNIYGGGYLGNVGIIDKRDSNNYKWTDSQGAYNKTGVCTVEVTGGTVGPDKNTDPKKGNVFGAGKGSAETFRCENAMAYDAIVTVSKGKVNGNVYGGGEIGRVENNTTVTIGAEGGTDEFYITGSVFGAGAGLSTHGYSALVRGNTEVTVQGKANIAKNVYGGGEMASVGRYGLNAQKMPNILLDGGDCKVTVKDNAHIEGDVYGASKGVEPQFNHTDEDHSKRSRRMVDYNAERYTTANQGSGDNLYWEYSDDTHNYVWEYFNDETSYLSYLETLALATEPDVKITGSAIIDGSVFGGGEMGLTKGSVTVSILGGTIAKDVYGGGALASTNTTDKVGIKTEDGYQMDGGNYVTTTVTPTTTVNLSGGVITGDAYGGGLGRRASNTETAVEPLVCGDVTVKLNEGKTGSDKGCIVNRVFGCNNLNGTPQAHVRVYVYATQHKDKDKISEKFVTPDYDPDRVKNTDNTDEDYKVYLKRVIDAATGVTGVNQDVINAATTVYNTSGATEAQCISAAKSVNQAVTDLYDVQAVYGGGNLATYEPTNPKTTDEYAEVIINGCELTSIKQVYGSGNAASTPATSVTVNGTYVIDEVFGGGNGADNYQVNGVWYENPGANVGYYDYTELNGSGAGLETDPYQCKEKDNADTKEERQRENSPYVYGTGITNTLIRGGTVHRVYGGSNRKGNIRTEAKSAAEASGDCDLHVGQVYGAGKSAPIDGNVNQDVKCASGVEEIFGGSKNSDVNSNIYLKITNGSSLKRVFGGNNTSGKVNGSITVEVEEGGCEPIHIKELYAGGYLAAYSIYGYKSVTQNGATVWLPRTKDDWEEMTAEEKEAEGLTTPREDPRINIISATRIDTIFGGGYQATVIGDTHINVNMTKGKVIVEQKDGVYKDAFGNTYDAASVGDGNAVTLDLGTIGHIFGGGNLADIEGDTYVEIGTGEWINKEYKREMLGTAEGVEGTKTFTYNETSKKWEYAVTTTTTDPETSVETTTTTMTPVDSRPTPSRNEATITENVFGGGKGVADHFECAKAMVNGENGTHVLIGKALVKGNVYGGGMIGRVENNTNVTIGLESGTDTLTIQGHVFGAGAGVNTHGYSALVRGQSRVVVQGKAKVLGSVYGGGEKASVGKYKVVNGLPEALYDENSPTSGYCYVTVKDNAEIGPDNMQMFHDGVDPADDAPDDAGHVFGAGKGVLPYEGYTDEERPYHMNGIKDGNNWKDDPKTYPSYHQILTDEQKADSLNEYFKFIKSLALATETHVNIEGNAFVKGSVYGGSENGFVQHNTHVTIDGNCQIGNGYVQMDDDGNYLTDKYSLNRPYTEDEWIAGKLNTEGHYSSSLPECASWPYGIDTNSDGKKDVFAPHDKYASTITGKEEEYDEDTGLTSGRSTNGGRRRASDGHTFYGNVFGGGSGYYPFRPGRWFEWAGAVHRNTYLTIKGGHILTSVYGGNEMTDVGYYHEDTDGNIVYDSLGTCYVTMIGGTLGVPRTLKQIAAHPVTCYLFGAGKGDQRIFFNESTDIGNAVVHISDDARIYGSVFGGGEDGHVMENVKLTIGSSTLPDSIKNDPAFTGVTLVGSKVKDGIRYPYIGTTGTSYVEGNVFGAGRGFSGDALTAGSVGGNVELNIAGGTMLGSVYGGGRLASVGIPFTYVNSTKYGSFQEDTDEQTHGHVTVNISGGTIGNDREIIYSSSATTAEDRVTELATIKSSNKIPYTEYEYDSKTKAYRPLHNKGGNVFGGSMGRLEKLDGTINTALWHQLGEVKTATINITQKSDDVPTIIKGCVYGGAELGTVRDSTLIVVGKDKDGTLSKPTIIRDLYGGGYGSDDNRATSAGYVQTKDEDNNNHAFRFIPMQWAGCVGIKSEIDIYSGWVKRNVYGGGELASVGIFNYEVELDGEGKPTDNYKSIVKHDNVDNGFALSWPYKVQYLPNYTGNTYINVYGGRLGVSDADNTWKDNGDIYGGSKGKAGDRYDMAFCGNVDSVNITIHYPDSCTALPSNYQDDLGKWCIAGAVYGGGEDGHVMGSTNVTLKNGLIGHSLYGGGSGKGKYQQTIKRIDTKTDTLATIYSISAGKIYGNTKVRMEKGYVLRNVYGGGNMGSVGKGNYAGAIDDYSYYNDGAYNGYGEKLVDEKKLWTSVNMGDSAWHFLNSGKAEVEIIGGQVGYIASKPSDSMKDGLPYGNVFGGCRGESAPNIGESPRYWYSPEFFSGYVNETKVIIGDSTNTDASYKGPAILGSVYGGGQDGHVRRDTRVIVVNGEIGLAFDKNTDDKTNVTKLGTDPNDTQWLTRGNVYGAGSGIGKYEYDFNYNGRHTVDTNNDGIEDKNETEIETYNYTNPQTGRTSPMKEVDYSTSAGSVTRFTKVEVKGGIIHRNVYGGGSMSSVGPPKIPPTRTDGDGFHPDDAAHKNDVGRQTLNEVIIGGMKVAGKVVLTYIGDSISYAAGYGGNVFGASRGDLSIGDSYGTSVWTKVFVKNGSNILGNVFGGGDNGMVKQDSEVIIGEAKAETTSGQEPGQGEGD